MKRLIIDTPSNSENLLYGSGFYCLDPFVYLEIDGKKIGWLPATEIEKAKKISKLDTLYNMNDQLQDIRVNKKFPPLKSSIILEYLEANNLEKRIAVPESFGVQEADNLRNHGVILDIIEEPFYEARVIKSADELSHIREVSKKNVQVMDEVKNILAAGSITNDGKISYQGEILTSEFMQNFILKRFLELGLITDSVIVAGGNDGCDPHEHGSGPLMANTSIIVDIFPRSRSTYYHSDMTRTFCKGKASQELKYIYNAVAQAQQYALDTIKAGASGLEIHQTIYNLFEEKGYSTGVIDNVLQGFFHGTGHGLGLACHELPYISRNDYILEAGHVVTVEPGLYYIDKGAVRIEDLVFVTEDGAENVTVYEKCLEVE